MAELQYVLEGLLLVGMAGGIGSLLVWILETITAEGYVPKKERKRRAALLKAKK